MIFKKSIGSALLFCFSLILMGQSPYELSWKKEGIILGLGGLTQGVAILLEPQINTYSETDIQNFNRSAVFRFEVQATYNLSHQSGKFSDDFKGGSYLLQTLFLIPKRTRKDALKISLLYGETFLLTKGITTLTKRIAKRPRPYVYNENALLSDKMERSARYSFFSGHTSMTSANCFFFAKVFSDYFPDSKLKPYVWGVAILVPAATGYFRVKAGEHFPTDAITGYALGAVIGYVIPHIHRSKTLEGLHVSTGLNSFALSYTF